MLTKVVFYFLPLALFQDLLNGDYFSVLKDFLLVSYPRYWFFRDYLFLFMFSPILNKYLETASVRQRIYILAILAFMSIWVGTSLGCKFLAEGKNLTNFMLLYVVGNTLNKYKEKWKNIPQKLLITAFIILNFTIVILWAITYDSKVSTLIWLLSFPYCSPLLYVNAILVFMIIGKLSFESKIVNYIASSVFAVYLIHYHPFILNRLIIPGSDYILSACSNLPSRVIPFFFLYAIIIFVLCILIDKLLHPIWIYSDRLFSKIDTKINES